MNITHEHYASVYKDLDREVAARNRAARAELPCSECGSNFGMIGGWTREAIANIKPTCQLYSCKRDDHALYSSCPQCNPNGILSYLHLDFVSLTPEQVTAWLARECQCPDCKRERGET